MKYVRILTCLIAALALVFPISGCSQLGVDDLMYDDLALYSYRENGDGTVVITSYAGAETALELPDKLYGLTVSGIGESAFAGSALRSVTLGSAVSVIENGAFEDCRSLASVNLDHVTDIGENAFRGCRSLAEAQLAEALNIGDRAFEDCSSLAALTLGSGKDVRIGQYSFSGCSALSTLTGGHSARYDVFAFAGCSSLTSLSFTEDARLGGQVFDDCTMLTRVDFTGDELPQYLDKWGSSIPTFPTWTAVNVSDEYSKRCRRYIYGDSTTDGRLFPVTVKAGGGEAVIGDIDFTCPIDPCNGSECIDCTVTLPNDDSAGGWSLVNSCRDADGKTVAASGEFPDGGVSLKGAKNLVFYAKSRDGGDRMTFYVGGLGYDAEGAPTAEYPDSCPRIYERFTLSDEWQRFSIDLSGADLSYLQCGFGFYGVGAECADDLEIYFDDIYFEGSFK